MSGTSGLVQYVLVRGDLARTLRWPSGAVIAQACHACVAVTHAYYSDPDTRAYLEDLGNMRKVVLEVSRPTVTALEYTVASRCRRPSRGYRPSRVSVGRRRLVIRVKNYRRLYGKIKNRRPPRPSYASLVCRSSDRTCRVSINANCHDDDDDACVDFFDYRYTTPVRATAVGCNYLRSAPGIREHVFDFVPFSHPF